MSLAPLLSIGVAASPIRVAALGLPGRESRPARGRSGRPAPVVRDRSTP